MKQIHTGFLDMSGEGVSLVYQRETLKKEPEAAASLVSP